MNNNPLVSLLVAMRNEESHIEDCINSILDQDYPLDGIEVLIFDGRSEDSSRKVVEKIIAGKKNCSLVDNPRKIQSAAWNLGIQLSHGEVISIVSGHVKLSSDYVSKAIETLMRTNAEMVGGTVRAKGSGYIGEVIALAMSTPFGIGGATFRYTEEEEETDSVFMGFCKRAVYENIGGFDEELVRNQDDEFSYRLLKTGGRIVCNPKIVSYYTNRATLLSLWNQYFQYGFWKVRVLQKHTFQMRLRQFVPPVFVMALFGSALLSAFPSIWFLSLVVPVMYLMANLLASLLIAGQRGLKYLPLLPLSFAVLHFSYGLGFWAGLVKFWNRWGDKIGKVPGWSNETTG